MVELLDNPDHRGTFQTMQNIAAIYASLGVSASGLLAARLHPCTLATSCNVDKLCVLPHTQSNSSQQTVFDFFYVVVTVFPSNDECLTTQQGFIDSLVTLETADNYNPAPYTEGGRVKNVTILVEPALGCKWRGYSVRCPYYSRNHHSCMWAGLRESLYPW